MAPRKKASLKAETLDALKDENLPGELIAELRELARPEILDAPATVRVRLDDAPSSVLPLRVNGRLLATLRLGETAVLSPDALPLLAEAGVTFTLE